MEFEGLERLEGIVGRLLSQHAELQKQNEILAAELEEKSQELGKLSAEIHGMQGDKEKVHHRVTSILTKLEEWEQARDGSESADQQVDQVNSSVDQESQNKLFNMGV